MSATATALRSFASGGEDVSVDLFRPHLFFSLPWEGSGEVVGSRGQRLAGFTVSGQGRVVGGQDHIAQHWAFDNGYRHEVEWRILCADGADYRAIDVETGAEARGRQVADDAFAWTAKVKGRTPLGHRSMKVSALYRMVSPQVVIVEADATILGAMVIGRMTATLRRLSI